MLTSHYQHSISIYLKKFFPSEHIPQTIIRFVIKSCMQTRCTVNPIMISTQQKTYLQNENDRLTDQLTDASSMQLS